VTRRVLPQPIQRENLWRYAVKRKNKQQPCDTQIPLELDPIPAGENLIKHDAKHKKKQRTEDLIFSSRRPSLTLTKGKKKVIKKRRRKKIEKVLESHDVPLKLKNGTETDFDEEVEIEKYVEEAKSDTQLASVYNVFFKEISKYPLLTASEEKDLSRRIREEHDAEAFNLFVMSNLRLALACVRDVQKRMGGNTILDFMDLAQEAVLGLMTAVERFDYKKGTRFSTYGIYWIYQKVKRAIVSQRKGLSVPGFAGESVFSMSEYINLYKDGKIDEIPKKYRKRVRDLTRLTANMIPFGTPDEAEESGEKNVCEEFFNSDKTTEFSGVRHDIMDKFFIDECHRLLKRELNDFERDIVLMKFGLAPYNLPASNQEIGDKYNVSGESIRVTLDGVLKRMKKNRRAAKLMREWIGE
jgi:RNA polymerase primary sigma factor